MTKWDEAIADARRKIADLKKAIKIFEMKKAMGEKWPDSTTKVSGAGNS